MAFDITSDLIVHLPMQDTGATTTLYGEIGSDGVLIGGETAADRTTTGPTDGVNARLPLALDFTGVSGDYADIATNGHADDWTWAAWVRPNATQPNTLVGRLAQTQGIRMVSDPGVQVSYGGTGSGTTTLSCAAWTVGVWTHVAVTGASNTIKLYRNGILVDTGTRAGTSFAMSQFGVRNGNYANYACADFRGYDRCLTDDDIAKLASFPTDAVNWTEFAWCGGVEQTVATVVARLGFAGDARLVVSTSADYSSPTYSGMETADAERVVKMSVSGLTANTQYYWATEVDGNLDTNHAGTFKTLPTALTPSSFSFAASADGGSSSNIAVYDHIRSRDPLFFIHSGDLFYHDITTDDVTLYQRAFRNTLGQGRQAGLYRNVPIVYTWDDHDYADNESNAASPSRPAARTTYQQYVPHHALEAGDPEDTPIYQTFVAGRVRFIILDNRSEASDQSMADGPLKTRLGATQLAWLEDVIETANESLLVICCGVPWIGDASDNDTWGDYATERNIISDMLEDNAKTRRTIIIAADMHAVCMDDGTNSQYSTSGTGPGPVVLQFAALDRTGSSKGGPYSSGAPSEGANRYGIVTISDNGTDIYVSATGYRYDEATDAAIPITSLFFVAGQGIFAGSAQSDQWLPHGVTLSL